MTRQTLLALGGVAVIGGAGALYLLFRAPPEPAVPVCKTLPPSPQPTVPGGWRVFSGVVSATATDNARAALALPMGSQTTFLDDDGSLLGIVVMWHCHDPSEGVKPVGWHKGATLFRIG